MKQHLVRVFAFLLLVLCADRAEAASGYVKGRILFLQKNGGYCPTARDCTGAYYTASQFNSYQPLRNLQVEIESEDAGVIGRGTTNDSGNFTVAWSRSGNLPRPDRTRVWFKTRQEDTRFEIRGTSGGIHVNWGSYFTIESGTTQAAPQNVGTMQYGENPYLNAYWAAESLWRRRLSWVGHFGANFTGVEIRGFSYDMPDFISCTPNTFNCASGSMRQIRLDPNAGFNPQHRVMHELGHVAAYIANTHRSTGAWGGYSYDGDSTWDLTSTEWATSAWEEAIATFAADTTLYDATAVAPYTCSKSKFHCDNFAHPLEAVNEGCGPSGEDRRRRPINMHRFMWDIYDDSPTEAGDALTLGDHDNYWKIWNAWLHYVDGTDQYETDEPFDSSGNFAQGDGRGARSYVFNLERKYGFDAGPLRSLSCNPL